MSILVTGSKGYIGTILCDELNRQGIKFIECDKKVGTHCNYNYIYDEEYDTLIHLGALTCEPESFKNPHDYIDNNISGFIRFINRNKFKQVIYMSSASVYNDAGEVAPSSIYGLTKLAGETILKTYGPIKHWNLRLFNPFGVSPKHKQYIADLDFTTSSVFFSLAKALVDKTPFSIYNASMIRDFFPVNFISHIIIQYILNGFLQPGTYDIGSGIPVDVKLLLTDVCRELGIDYKLVTPEVTPSTGYYTEDILEIAPLDLFKESILVKEVCKTVELTAKLIKQSRGL